MGFDRDFIWRRYLEECSAAKSSAGKEARTAHQQIANRFNEQIRIMGTGRPPNFVA
ncbi:hypothetical protein SAMN06295912_101337 [Sphingomonas laterariae]|uniref:Uncharacterized protein n=1 Tax=Edaphosphingomonas laterariae TaxID=861865 RepID=A0A239BPH6_9SPHN|nr:hypothetical protein [Sphingomonas laterariae]SNS09995.1 hypothetical protein SAMN06295912_101337 [Sphingomonas laterariae]